MRSKFAAIATTIYLLVVAFALAYPLIDHRTFSGLFAVVLALPWIDYMATEWFPVAIALNALIIYLVAAALAHLPALLRR